MENCIDSEKQYSNENQLPVAEKSLGSCELCPTFLCSSKTEETRYESMFYCRSSTKIQELSFHCKYQGCEKSFSSQPSLSQHQINSKHRKRVLKKKKCSILNVSCTVFSDSSSEDGSSSDNEDNECDASRYLSTQSAARSKKRK